MNKKKIAIILRRRRKQLGLTQKDVSEASGVCVVTVVRMEQAEGYSIDSLMSVLRVIGLSFAVLHNDEVMKADIDDDPEFLEFVRPLYEDYKKLKTK